MKLIFGFVGCIFLATAQAPEFEVASVKRAGPSDLDRLAHFPAAIADKIGFEGGPGTKNPERINYKAVSLQGLLARAFNLKAQQISGPSWLESERYVIEAVVPSGANPEELRLMLQKLLTERFQMTVHHETKSASVYRLKVAKNGPKLAIGQPMPQYKDDEERRAAMQQRSQENLEAMKRKVALGMRGARTIGLQNGTVERFAELLSSNVDHPVRDMTGLAGNYSFNLEWSADTSAESLGPSLFSAIQEQLGLKLEAGQEQLAFLVVDKAEKTPTSN